MSRDYAGTTSDYSHTTVNGLGGVDGSGTAYTLAGWLYADTIAPAFQCPFNLFVVGTSRYSRPLVKSDGAVLWQENGVTALASTTSATSLIGATAWHHIAVRRTDNTTRSLFVDGGNETTNSTDTGNCGLTRAAAGVCRYNTSSVIYPFNGKVAEVGLWDVSLSDADIAALAAAHDPARIRPDALVRHWRLQGMSDPEPDRYGGNGMTLVGTGPGAAHPRLIHAGHNRVHLPPGAAPPATSWPHNPFGHPLRGALAGPIG